MNNDIGGAIRIYCGLCPYSTEMDKAFISHCNSEHGREFGYWCRDCETFVHSPIELVAHIKNSCTKLKTCTFQCGVEKWSECDFSTKDTLKFKEHFRVQHKGVHLMPCKECHKLFTNPSCLILHIQNKCVEVHEAPPPKSKRSGRPRKESKKSINKPISTRSKAVKKSRAVKAKTAPLKTKVSVSKVVRRVLRYRNCAKTTKVGLRNVANVIAPNEASSSSKQQLVMNVGKARRRSVLFYCDLCPYYTKMDKAFIVHYGKEHKYEMRYWCRKCGHVVDSPPELVAHVRDSCTKLRAFTFECGVSECNFSSPDTYKFREHVKIRHRGVHLIPCKNCDKFFTSLPCLFLHMQKKCIKNKRSRKTPRSDTSDMSKSSFRGTRQAIGDDLTEASDESEHNSNVSSGSEKIPSLENASGSKEAVNGQYCVGNDEVATVIAPCESSFSKQQLITSDGKADVRFHCGLCPYNTKSDKTFVMHYDKDHKKECDYWCRNCGHVVNSPIELAAHIRDNCTKVKSFTFRCGVGNCVFSSEDTYKFRRHVKMRHAGVHLLPCKECNKLFTILSCLILHMQSDCLKRRRLSPERQYAFDADKSKKLKRGPAKSKKASSKRKKDTGNQKARKGRKCARGKNVTPPKKSPQRKKRRIA